MFDIDVSRALQTLSIALVPALLGIILHEVAHGWAAARQGDPTARSLGRLTLNPIPHIDPVGLLVFVVTSLSNAFVFGWAKPVPVDPRYFRNPSRGMMLVALAGPITNFLLALAFGGLLWCALTGMPDVIRQNQALATFIVKSLYVGVVINFGLGWLNLLPIPPLDGSKVVAHFLPGRLAWQYMRMERYGFVILIVLLATHMLDRILTPLVLGSARGYLDLLGIL